MDLGSSELKTHIVKCNLSVTVLLQARMKTGAKIAGTGKVWKGMSGKRTGGVHEILDRLDICG